MKKVIIINNMFKLENAIEVAEQDYNIGVYDAIDKLAFYGFNCDSFWATINDAIKKYGYDLDSEIFLNARDNLYKKLGIEDLMKKAYEIVWE